MAHSSRYPLVSTSQEEEVDETEIPNYHDDDDDVVDITALHQLQEHGFESTSSSSSSSSNNARRTLEAMPLDIASMDRIARATAAVKRSAATESPGNDSRKAKTIVSSMNLTASVLPPPLPAAPHPAYKVVKQARSILQDEQWLRRHVKSVEQIRREFPAVHNHLDTLSSMYEFTPRQKQLLSTPANAVQETDPQLLEELTHKFDKQFTLNTECRMCLQHGIDTYC